MRWQQGRRSPNVEDRRGQKVKKAGAIGGGTALSQMTDTALRISACTAMGLILGLALDAKRCDR